MRRRIDPVTRLAAELLLIVAVSLATFGGVMLVYKFAKSYLS